jgi:hypothetical protein
MLANWPTVTPDDSSIVKMSEWSCSSAAETAVLELEVELDEPSDEQPELGELGLLEVAAVGVLKPVVPAIAVLGLLVAAVAVVELVVATLPTACAWCRCANAW